MKNKLLWGLFSISIMMPCIVWASGSNGWVQGHQVSSSQYLENTCVGNDAIKNFSCDYTGDTVVLRKGYGVEFYDTFYAGNQNRRLFDMCAGIIEPTNNGDYNNGINPDFIRTDDIIDTEGFVKKNSNMKIIQTEREYQIRKNPLERSPNNLMVKYVVEYANSDSDSATRYQHTECYPYIISRCGDGVVDEDWDGKTADKPAEECDPEAPERKNRSDGKVCNSLCKIEYGAPVCSSTYNGMSMYTSSSTPWLNGTENLCDIGTPIDFTGSATTPRIYTWKCKNGSQVTPSTCVARQEWCGDGTKNGSESCDFNDTTNTDGRGNGGCSPQCKPVVVEDPMCNSTYNGQRLQNLTEGSHLCTKGTYTGFSYNGNTHMWTRKCNNTLGKSVDCSATKPYCGDGTQDPGEECDDGSKNGTSTSACSATCTSVSNISCGSLGGGTTYFPEGKQTTPWLTKTSAGMCSNGAIVGIPYITGTDSHIEWTCSNVNGTSIYCKAYQQYCGDGSVNGGEECDGTEGCDSLCNKVTQSTECQQTFTGQLRLGYNEPFTDTFSAGGRDRYLYYKDVIFKENHGNYDNSSTTPEFNWTSELVNHGMKVDANTSMIVIESNPYHIVSAPSRRARNNLYIEYTIRYDNVKHSTTPQKSNLYSHKECAYYEISRCGDGELDTKYGEQCDPGSEGTNTLPNGKICNSECKIVDGGQKGTQKVEKTLLSERYVTHTGQELKWKIKVTASGGYLKDVVITDDLPSVLSYVRYESNLTSSSTVTMLPNQPKITSGGKHLEWKTTGILNSGDSIVLQVTTKVEKMPDKNGYENVACARAEGLDERCDRKPIETGNPDLRIKKTFTDGSTTKTVKSGDTIAYRIEFGNNGDAPATITSIKDFLPKNVKYLTGRINKTSSHGYDIQLGDEVIMGFTVVDGVHIEIYGGMTLEPNARGYIILTGIVLGENKNNRTNFACIYLNNKVVECDNVTHNFNEVKCSSDIKKRDSADLCEGESWTVPVKCESTGGVADTIEILCDGKSQKSGTNISNLNGKCTFLSDGNHEVMCKVNGKTTSVDNCKGTYTLSHHDCEGGDVKCSSDIKKRDSADLCEGESWVVPVRCESTGGVANTIEILCDGKSQKSGTNISNLGGRCTFLSNGTHEVMCKVNGKTTSVDNCEGIYTLSHHDCEGGDVKCSSNIEKRYSKSMCEGRSWTVPVRCESTGGIADTIEILCDGETQKKGTSISNLAGKCTFSSEGSHNVMCKVNNRTTSVDNCEGTYTLNYEDCPDPTPSTTEWCKNHADDPICNLSETNCFNVNAGNISIESGEILPFYLNIEKDRSKRSSEYDYVYLDPDKYPMGDERNYQRILDNEESCSPGAVILNSMICKYVVMSRDANINEKKIVYRGSAACLDDGDSYVRAKPLIRNWIIWQNREYDFMQTLDIDGTSYTYAPKIGYITDTNWRNNLPNLGEYEFKITDVKYLQCDGDGKWMKGKTEEVCQSNLVLTEPYTVQKTPSGNLTTSIEVLKKFQAVDGSRNVRFSDYLSAISASDYEQNQKVNDAMSGFINKYEKLAVKIEKDGKQMKKVPGKNIYFISGDYTIAGGNFDKPFTFVQTNPNSTITINGNSNLNMMILSRGNIAFKGNCTSNQTVKGIFYTEKSLIRTGVLHNDSLSNNVWCDKGGLNIKGVLIGNNFNKLMKNSRSHLETWFKKDGSKSDSKQELTKSIMNGGSVVIEYSPSIFTKSTMPPGAEYFVTALSIYKN